MVYAIKLLQAHSLHLPPKVKRRGRPKGADVTVIGMKKSKKRKLLTYQSLAENEKVAGQRYTHNYAVEIYHLFNYLSLRQ